MNNLDSLLKAAHDRQSPWDAARQDRVLTKALDTRALREGRAHRRATRLTVASACGAILLFGFGLRAVAFSPASAASANTSIPTPNSALNAGGASNHADVAQEPSDTESSQAPSVEELASLAKNDGGYSRD